jgi:solute carrier family 35 protein
VYNLLDRLSHKHKIDTSLDKLFLVDRTSPAFKSLFSLRVLIALFYSLHSVLSLKALSGLNIPIYIMFKRCTPLANLILSIFVFKNAETRKKHSRNIILSILMMTFGVVLASVGDLEFDLYSYMYCGFSVVCQAFYLSTIQKYGEVNKANSLQTFFECSVLSVPILSALMLFAHEKDTLVHDTALLVDAKYVSVLLVVIVSGSLLCFSQFWCTLMNNAVTTSVLGVLKSLVQTLFSILLFQSWTSISLLTYLGIGINLVSGSVYTYLKFVEIEARKEMNKNESSNQLNGNENISNC